MYTWRRFQILLLSSTFLVAMLIEKPLTYGESLTKTAFLETVSMFLALNVGFTAITIVLIYVGNLQNRLDFVSSQNEKLLHRMHEGTLILAKQKTEIKHGEKKTPILFINNAASKSLKKFLTVSIHDSQSYLSD